MKLIGTKMNVGIDVRPILDKPAGIGHYVKGLIRGFDDLDTDCEYYLYTNQDFQLSSFENESFHKIIINRSPLFWHFAVFVDLLKRRIDVYHSSHSLIIPSFPFIKCVLTIHDASSVLFAKKHALKVRVVSKFLFRLAAAKARFIIVPSVSTKKDVLGITGVAERKVIVIPEGYDEPSVSWKKDNNNPYILFLGTLEPRKNIANLIYAFKILVDKYQRREKLIIAGKKGWLYNHLFGLVKLKSLENAVEFKGYVSEEEKTKLLSGASVFVFPSIYEGFGLPVLEAMSVGVPVVTSNISSLPEVVDTAAILVNPNDPGSIAFHINRILSDSRIAEELSKKGKKRAKNFSWEKTAKETHKVYQRASHSDTGEVMV